MIFDSEIILGIVLFSIIFVGFMYFLDPEFFDVKRNKNEN